MRSEDCSPQGFLSWDWSELTGATVSVRAEKFPSSHFFLLVKFRITSGLSQGGDTGGMHPGGSWRVYFNGDAWVSKPCQTERGFFLCYKTKRSRRGNLSWTRNLLLVRSKWKIVNIMKTLCFYLVCFKSCESTHYTPVVLMCFFLCALSTSQMSDCCWNLHSAWDNCFVCFFICPSTADIEHGLENWSGYLSPTAAQSIKTTDI